MSREHKRQVVRGLHVHAHPAFEHAHVHVNLQHVHVHVVHVHGGEAFHGGLQLEMNPQHAELQCM